MKRPKLEHKIAEALQLLKKEIFIFQHDLLDYENPKSVNTHILH